MKTAIRVLIIALATTLLSYGSLSDNYTPTQYTIQTGVTAFTVPWTFFDTDNLQVTITDTDGVDKVLTEGAGADQYSVSAVNNDYSQGATITTVTTYPENYQITIERIVDYSQELEINGDFIPAEPLETQLDKIVAQIQQTEDEIGRTLTIPATDTAGLTTEFPNAASRASKIASFDASGNLTVIDPVDSGTISVDDVTIEQDGTTLQVKDGGIDTTQLADEAVSTAKLASPTGADTNVVTGTAGADGQLAGWNADGDAVDSGLAVNDVATEAYVDSAVNLPYLHIREEQGAGTNGSPVSATWAACVLNTEVTNTVGSTLSSNQFTLSAGTYRIRARIPNGIRGGTSSPAGQSMKARLYNSTDESQVLISSSSIGVIYGARNGVFDCFISGKFSIATSKTFQIQHIASGDTSAGKVGYAVNLDSQPEIYTEVEIWKVQ